MEKEELEGHLRRQMHARKHLPPGLPAMFPNPTAPNLEFELVPPKLGEMRQVVQKAK